MNEWLQGNGQMKREAKVIWESPIKDQRMFKFQD